MKFQITKFWRTRVYGLKIFISSNRNLIGKALQGNWRVRSNKAVLKALLWQVLFTSKKTTMKTTHHSECKMWRKSLSKLLKSRTWSVKIAICRKLKLMEKQYESIQSYRKSFTWGMSQKKTKKNRNLKSNLQMKASRLRIWATHNLHTKCTRNLSFCLFPKLLRKQWNFQARTWKTSRIVQIRK